MALTLHQQIKYKGKNWKVVAILDNDRYKLKCMVCGGKFEIVHKDQI